MKEIWKEIVDYESMYLVSNRGRVKSLKRKNARGNLLKTKILKPGKNTDGYLYVTLCKDKDKKQFRVSRLVALAFIPNPDGLPQVNHKNENKADNRVENLEWCTAKYNVNFGTSISRMRIKKERAICQMSKSGDLIKCFNSAKEASRELNIDHSRICKCLRNIPGYNSAGGFYWNFVRYANG